jgi:TonB family protein
MKRLLLITTLGFLLAPKLDAQPPGWRPSNYFYRTSSAKAALKREAALYAPPPEYPTAARRRRLEGTGLFALQIKPDGKVARVAIVKSTGHRLLDDAAISAFKRFWFRPGSISLVRAPIVFTMRPHRWDPAHAEMKKYGDAQTITVAGGES